MITSYIKGDRYSRQEHSDRLYLSLYQRNTNIMAVKNSKATTAPDLVEQSAAPLNIEIDLESAIADQLLDDIDWSKVKQALLKKAPARLFKWLQSQLLPIDGSPMITNEIEAIALSEGVTDA
jgi:hypothetical protein